MSTVIEMRLPAAKWELDTIHSTAGFALKYMVATFRTGFERFDATLDTTGDTPQLTGCVDPTSIAVREEHFHEHLQGPDFFDTERYPEIAFESTGWRTDGDVLVVDGNLTIKGDTRPLTARGELTPPHEDPFGGTRLGVALAAVVDRTQFGLDWNNPLPQGGLALADEVELQVDLQLVRADG